MHSARFDRLARILGATTTRRAGLGLVVAAFTGAAIADPASAATRCRRGRQTCQRNSQCCSGTCQTGRGFSTRERNRCSCEDGLALCGNACVDTDTDMRNCGACGNTCNAGDQCVDGQCRIHQQCYSSDGGGLCYMTPDGREHRAEGMLVIAHIGKLTPCARTADCADAYDDCDVPGVSCECVRAMDGGDGYQDPDDGAFCIPLLDSGDGVVTCSTEEIGGCVFSAAGDEVAVCTDAIFDAGDCVDYDCAGVGPCDEEDVSCLCVLAIMIPEVNFYIDLLITPSCLAYPSEAGLCPI